MIRIWLWEEAPVELRDYPGLPGRVAGTVPVWLAHVPAAEGDEADVFRGLAHEWVASRGREIHTVVTDGAGVLVAGCLADPPALTHPGRASGVRREESS